MLSLVTFAVVSKPLLVALAKTGPWVSWGLTILDYLK